VSSSEYLPLPSFTSFPRGWSWPGAWARYNLRRTIAFLSKAGCKSMCEGGHSFFPLYGWLTYVLESGRDEQVYQTQHGGFQQCQM
jgi:hypothetical protein